MAPSAAEMVVGRLPVLCMDEISTGLDSASTLLITRALRNLCAFLKVNIVIALLQPSPETYDIFDDIILMGDAQVRSRHYLQVNVPCFDVNDDLFTFPSRLTFPTPNPPDHVPWPARGGDALLQQHRL